MKLITISPFLQEKLYEKLLLIARKSWVVKLSVILSLRLRMIEISMNALGPPSSVSCYYPVAWTKYIVKINFFFFNSKIYEKENIINNCKYLLYLGRVLFFLKSNDLKKTTCQIRSKFFNDVKTPNTTSITYVFLIFWARQFFFKGIQD